MKFKFTALICLFVFIFGMAYYSIQTIDSKADDLMIREMYKTEQGVVYVLEDGSVVEFDY